MDEKLTIGKAARRSGVPAKTIRFYEDEGLMPAPGRSESGYRLYTRRDVDRLRFVRGMRLIGLDLPRIRSLLDRALSDTCAAFGEELDAVLAAQLTEVDRRIEELTALRGDLISLRDHVAHCCEGCPPDQLASECDFCDVLTDAKGGETHDVRPDLR